MAIHNPLRLPRRARGVAHGGRVALVQNRPVVDSRASANEFLVRRDGCELSVGGGAIGHHDELLDAFQVLGDALQRRHDRSVDEDDPVVGVVDHELQVLGEEPRVEGVQHRARAGHREIELEVTVVVPGQGADPVPGADSQLPERMRQLGHPAAEVRVGVAVTAGFTPGHDLLPGEQGGRPPEEVLECQRKVRHRATHRGKRLLRPVLAVAIPA